MTLSTTTRLGNHVFDGPFVNNGQLPNKSGVYIITTLADNGRHTIIDVGESEYIRERIANHDRSKSWRKNATNSIYAWILLSNESERMLIEKAHRAEYQPTCGDR